jgi:4-amino-4-deoxy-L-arabinose transferase-like glycosyltransferase
MSVPMTSADPVYVEVEHKHEDPSHSLPAVGWRLRGHLLVICFAVAVFIGCILSPPSLMDDVDAVQAQISANMVRSGDWVTPRVDGVVYMEKAPLKYWMIAVSFMVFGVHDWAARLPVALCVVLLCWVAAKFGEWAFGERAGMYTGLVLATCIGMFLFTRILISDCILTLAVTVAIFAFLRSVEDDEPNFLWPMLFWAALAAGVLLKGLIGLVFPVATAVAYLTATRRVLSRDTWARLKPVVGISLFIAVAAPWHVLAMIRNPPLVDFTLHSESGSYHGFFWFYFINEQLLRFLNRRYPRDYDTVPRVYFWLFHLVWLFPWSVYLPAVFRMDYRSADRASRVRMLALCWAGIVLAFFTLSTTQEYYSLPCYPALALLIGSAMASKDRTLRASTRFVAAVSCLGLAAIIALLYMVRDTPTPGDISAALNHQTPDVYALSLGHMKDLTLPAFAYLRLPLVLAAVAMAIGAFGSLRAIVSRAAVSLAIMMTLFFHAARQAMIVFDPYLSSRTLAHALSSLPNGRLIVDDPYWEFSSLLFYADKTAVLLNGRRNNLEYGSYAPGAPNVFIGDADFILLWAGDDLCYLAAEDDELPHLEQLVGKSSLHLVKEAGGKYLFKNK